MLPRITARTRARRTALVAAGALALLFSALHVPALASSQGPAGPQGPDVRHPSRDVPSSTHKVTLVTGDVVTLTVEGIGTIANRVVPGVEPIPVPAARPRPRTRPSVAPVGS